MLRQAQRGIPRILAHLAHQNSPTWPCHGWGLPALYCFWATWYPFPNINRILFNLFIHTGLPADILEHYSLVKSNSARSISSSATCQSLTPLRLYQSESCFISSPLAVCSNRVDLASFKPYPLFSTQTHLIFSPQFSVFYLSFYFRLQCKNKEKQDVLSLYCHFLLCSSWRYIQVLPMLRSCMNPPHNQLFCSCICDNQLLWFSPKAVQDRLNY